jgi:hypothetical protein
MRSNRRIHGLPMLIVALASATLLGGCSDLYYARRETVSPHGGDAVEANKVAQVVDPWPAAAANRKIETDGERMQRAIERYRTNKTTPLATTPSPTQYQPVLAPTQPSSTPPTQ